ncbi:hypothetical protein JKA74_06460 [Marivirga sp. S37H4]|uniref:Lipoprotein n=1 Tax=Marivirga aurantiaca TaxID=2802615 RepID=A0A935CA85_9BACT|nr:hypothetical protein [Marivirga aurantiaca]MBK6264673.1 hypothetical protein [Marivirga aurantiaca]
MKSIFILLIISLFSCNSSQESRISDSNESLNVLKKLILHDSLNQYGAISTELKTYKYFKIQYNNDSVQSAPPDGGYEWKNEEYLIEKIDLKIHFGYSVTKRHEKYQIQASSKHTDNLNLNSFNKDLLGLKHEGKDAFCVLYPPIFNHDSYAAYVQYDHFDNGYEEGNAAIFIKVKGEWIYLKRILGYITVKSKIDLQYDVA